MILKAGESAIQVKQPWAALHNCDETYEPHFPILFKLLILDVLPDVVCVDLQELSGAFFTDK